MKASTLKEISRANQGKSFKMSNKEKKKIAYLCEQFNLAVAMQLSCRKLHTN